MKALFASAAAAAFLIATPAFAQAGPTASANATASAEIVAPIAIENVDGISFGRLAAGVGGNVSVNAAGTLVSSNPNMVLAGSTGNAATFNVTGAGSLAYTAVVPTSVTLNSGSNSMTAALSKSGGGAALSGAGTDSFDVVGVLTVGAGQAAGNYSGTFAVTAAYN